MKEQKQSCAPHSTYLTEPLTTTVRTLGHETLTSLQGNQVNVSDPMVKGISVFLSDKVLSRNCHENLSLLRKHGRTK